MSIKNFTPLLADHRANVGATPMDYAMRENAYSNNVLVGNWFEERFADNTDKKAITPAIYGCSKCLQDKSLQQTDFIQPVPSDSRKDFDDYKQWKRMALRNRLNGEGTNIKLWDGDQYERNITTTQDVMFRILPEEGRRHGGEFDILKGKPKEDLLSSYGNSTRTGLLHWRACEERRDKNTPVDVSHYRHTFKRWPLKVQRQRGQGAQRKTSGLLCGGKLENILDVNEWESY